MSTVITLYDIPGTIPIKAWSPNVWVVRFALNVKGLAYKTAWIEYPDIAPELQKLGVEPTAMWADGSPNYTLPAIHDPRAGTYIADSLAIVEYLEKEYPSAGGVTLFPEGTRALQRGWRDAFIERCITKAGLPRIMGPAMYAHLSPRSAEYFRRTRMGWFDKPVEELAPQGSEERAGVVKAVVEGLDEVGTWLDKTNGKEAVFVMAEGKPCFADVLMASWLLWVRVLTGEDSDIWQAIVTASGGRWGRFMAEFKKWETVD